MGRGRFRRLWTFSMYRNGSGENGGLGPNSSSWREGGLLSGKLTNIAGSRMDPEWVDIFPDFLLKMGGFSSLLCYVYQRVGPGTRFKRFRGLQPVLFNQGMNDSCWGYPRSSNFFRHQDLHPRKLKRLAGLKTNMEAKSWWFGSMFLLE